MACSFPAQVAITSGGKRHGQARLLPSARTMNGRLFPALLRFWRNRRGLSQLDLALAAEVSARHLSFLESGRARPGETMLLRLLSTLQVPLRA
jgi:DNA-binding XRE family transcriptional regulator